MRNLLACSVHASLHFTLGDLIPSYMFHKAHYKIQFHIILQNLFKKIISSIKDLINHNMTNKHYQISQILILKMTVLS
jgi:hypothetical protein